MTDFILEILFPPELEEIVHGRLFLTRSTGSVSLRAGALEAYFVTVADRDAAAAALGDLGVELRSHDRPHVDWLQLYHQSLQSIAIGRTFVVAPDPALIPAGSPRHALVIPQEQAFGTGSHESTALAIELLEAIDLRGKLCLDIGAGTGILALAMRQLGARKAFACDIDPDAFRPLRENAIRNDIEIAAFIGTLDALRGGRFDVATMNILPEVIVGALPSVLHHLDGVLIVSGILDVQREYVADACLRRGLRLGDEARKGEWWAASFRA